MLAIPNHLFVLHLLGNSFQDYLLHHFSGIKMRPVVPRVFWVEILILISPSPEESLQIAITFQT